MRAAPTTLALLALLWCGPARAHGLDANRVQVVLHEDIVEAVATPPAAFVRQADRNGDGRLRVDEVRARQEEVVRALASALVITDEAGRAGAVERADVSVPLDDATRGADHLRLTVRLRWARPPRAVRVRCAFVGEHPVTVFATRAESRSTPGTLTLLGDGEYATLARADQETTLLGAPSAPPPAPPAPAPRWPWAALAAALLGGIVIVWSRVRAKRATVRVD